MIRIAATSALAALLAACGGAALAALLAACGGASHEPAAPVASAEPEPAETPTEAGVAPIPEGYERGPVAHLVVAGASSAIDYYEDVFGAEEIYRAPGPDGIILHAVIRIGDSLVTLSDEQPEAASFAPGKFGGSPVGLHVYVDDAAAAHARALDAGGTEKAPVRYQFYGDRHGSFTDPFGHTWSVATRVHDVPDDELTELAERAMRGEAIEEPEDAAPMSRPAGWNAVTPSLLVDDVADAAAFYGQAFGATTISMTEGPEGEPFHAEVRVRDQVVMLNAAPPADDDADPRPGTADPKTLGGTPVQLTYYVEDAEAAVARAKEAGASERLALQEMFWGDLWSEIEDPYGHVWSVATHVQDVDADEMRERTDSLSD